MSIVCPLGVQADIGSILDAVEGRLSDDADLTIHGGFIGARMFDRIVRHSPSVTLVGCTLGRGWWRLPKRARRCVRIYLQSCAASESPGLTLGCAAWPELSRLTVDEGQWDPELHSRNAMPHDPVPKDKSSPSGCTAWFIRAFSGPNLEALSVFDCPDVSFLQYLPTLTKLQELALSGCPADGETVEWATDQPELRSLDLSWKPGTVLPWYHLAKLRKLRELTVVDARFTDEDLEEVAKFSSVGTLHAWYTDLTNTSWPLVLSMPKLRSFWVSTEMLVGEIPSSLPAETRLREVVAMNVGEAHLEYLRELLSRYPNVKGIAM